MAASGYNSGFTHFKALATRKALISTTKCGGYTAADAEERSLNMSQANEINVRELLDSRPISAYQKWVIALCFLVVVMDGFDVVIMGFVGPALKEAWSLSNEHLAPVLSAALFGNTFGAKIAVTKGDKFGRRKVLCANVMLFGLFTLLVARAAGITEIIVYRFIAGLAMGGIMPLVATLAREYSPVRRAALLVTIVFAGFTVGAAGGGFLAAWMIPQWGWESVFVFGGVLPMLLSAIMLFMLPESVAFLVHKGESRAKIRKIVERCAPGTTTEASTFTIPLPQTVDNAQASPVKTLFNEYYRVGSVLLWLAYFLHLFLVYLLGSWMPTMIKEAGMQMHQAAIISAMFQLGGPLGSIMLGWFMDRFRGSFVLAAAYAFGAVILVVMSNAGGQYVLLCAAAFLMGAAFNGGGTGMNAFSSNFFPLNARATGNGWMHGIGRTGAILSAFAGAWMLGLGWNFYTIALALTVPAFAIVAVFLLNNWWYARRKAPVQAVPQQQQG